MFVRISRAQNQGSISLFISILFAQTRWEVFFGTMTFGKWCTNLAEFSNSLVKFRTVIWQNSADKWQNVGQTEWQFFCQLLFACNYLFCAQSLVKSTRGGLFLKAHSSKHPRQKLIHRELNILMLFVRYFIMGHSKNIWHFLPPSPGDIFVFSIINFTF